MKLHYWLLFCNLVHAARPQPMTVFDLTDICQGSEYVNLLDKRAQTLSAAAKSVTGIKKIKKSFQRALTQAGNHDWSKAAVSFHLTRHLTQGESVPTCYHAGSILVARGAQEALRVLDAAAAAFSWSGLRSSNLHVEAT